MTALEMSNAKTGQTVIMSDPPSDSIVKANSAERKWKMMAVTCVIATVLCGLVFAAILLFNHLSAESECPLRIISRNDWTAQPPEENPIPLNLPVERVIIAHTNTTSCTTQASCKLVVRSIQQDHVIHQKMDDIAYNFLIGGNGLIYNGRGWNAEGRHTKGFDANSICIAVVGTFDYVTPPQVQLDATQKLITEGVKLKKIHSKYRLYGQRQLMHSTSSPGRELYEIIKTWRQWTADIK